MWRRQSAQWKTGAARGPGGWAAHFGHVKPRGSPDLAGLGAGRSVAVLYTGTPRAALFLVAWSVAPSATL